MSHSSPRRPSTSPRAARTFAETLERTLAQTPGKAGALASSALAGLLGIASCDPAEPARAEQAEQLTPGELQQAVIAYGQKDWAQQYGTRNTSKVVFYQEYWRDFSDTSGRFGLQSITVFIKLRVKPTPGADLSKKRVGVNFREVGQPNPITSFGRYFSTHGDGYEEWHVPVKSRRFEGTLTFDAFYEDGAGGLYYDDNMGELYAVQWNDPVRDYSTMRLDYGRTTAKLDGTGVSGQLVLVVADLDFDKVVEVRYSTDNWTTTQTLPMGSSGEKNKVYYESDLGADYDVWKADLNLPGSFSRFQYKLVYRHGVTGGATPTEFVSGILELRKGP